MSGCSGDRRVPVCFDVKLEPFLDTNLIFSRADYNSRKSNKNRCLLHAPVNGKQTEQDDTINMRLSHKRDGKISRTATICLFTPYWLSLPGSISYRRQGISILHLSPFSHDFLVAFFNRNITSYFPLLVSFFTSYRHKTSSRLLLPLFDIFVKCSAYFSGLPRYVNTETTFFRGNETFRAI